MLRILEELIETIELMLENEQMYLLTQNKNEAIEWLSFLKNHTDKEELKSLENEIANRLFINQKEPRDIVLWLFLVLVFGFMINIGISVLIIVKLIRLSEYPLVALVYSS